MKTDNLTILSVGLAGCSGRKTGCTIDYGTSAILDLARHLMEGGYLIDKSGVLSANPTLAIDSPMCDCQLTGSTVNRIDVSPSIVLDVIADQEGEHGALARLAKREAGNPSDHPGPFDYVSPATYAGWWAKRGAVVGQRKGDFIEWFDGVHTKIAIPDF